MQPELLEALAGEVVLVIKSALGPVLERLAAAETRLATLGDLRDRVITVETKAAIPAPPVDLGDVRDRLLAVETRASTPGMVEISLADLRDRFAALEARVNSDVATKEIGALRERMAVVETRAPVPGPAGKDGDPGTNGADGLGFDDLAVDFDGDRTLALTFARGDQKKSFPIALPFLRYCGVYQDGKAYDVGDVTTWAGSTWSCKSATTTKPGEGSPAWVLIVKRGRDGKDGVDAPGALPVVSVGRPR